MLNHFVGSNTHHQQQQGVKVLENHENLKRLPNKILKTRKRLFLTNLGHDIFGSECYQ